MVNSIGVDRKKTLCTDLLCIPHLPAKLWIFRSSHTTSLLTTIWANCCEIPLVQQAIVVCGVLKYSTLNGCCANLTRNCKFRCGYTHCNDQIIWSSNNCWRKVIYHNLSCCNGSHLFCCPLNYETVIFMSMSLIKLERLAYSTLLTSERAKHNGATTIKQLGSLYIDVVNVINKCFFEHSGTAE